MYAEEKWQRILLENGFSGPKNSNDEIKKKWSYLKIIIIIIKNKFKKK